MKRSTRGIKLDYHNLGDKLSMTQSACHKCKASIDAKSFICENVNKKRKCEA